LTVYWPEHFTDGLASVAYALDHVDLFDAITLLQTLSFLDLLNAVSRFEIVPANPARHRIQLIAALLGRE